MDVKETVKSDLLKSQSGRSNDSNAEPDCLVDEELNLEDDITEINFSSDEDENDEQNDDDNIGMNLSCNEALSDEELESEDRDESFCEPRNKDTNNVTTCGDIEHICEKTDDAYKIFGDKDKPLHPFIHTPLGGTLVEDSNCKAKNIESQIHVHIKKEPVSESMTTECENKSFSNITIKQERVAEDEKLSSFMDNGKKFSSHDGSKLEAVVKQEVDDVSDQSQPNGSFCYVEHEADNGQIKVDIIDDYDEGRSATEHLDLMCNEELDEDFCDFDAMFNEAEREINKNQPSTSGVKSVIDRRASKRKYEKEFPKWLEEASCKGCSTCDAWSVGKKRTGSCTQSRGKMPNKSKKTSTKGSCAKKERKLAPKSNMMTFKVLVPNTNRPVARKSTTEQFKTITTDAEKLKFILMSNNQTVKQGSPQKTGTVRTYNDFLNGLHKQFKNPNDFLITTQNDHSYTGFDHQAENSNSKLSKKIVLNYNASAQSQRKQVLDSFDHLDYSNGGQNSETSNTVPVLGPRASEQQCLRVDGMGTPRKDQSYGLPDDIIGMTCIECWNYILWMDHFRNLPACPKCGYQTNCCRSHVSHVTYAHKRRRKDQETLVDDEFMMNCACGIKLRDGDKMARHLLDCEYDQVSCRVTSIRSNDTIVIDDEDVYKDDRTQISFSNVKMKDIEVTGDKSKKIAPILLVQNRAVTVTKNRASTELKSKTVVAPRKSNTPRVLGRRNKNKSIDTEFVAMDTNNTHYTYGKSTTQSMVKFYDHEDRKELLRNSGWRVYADHKYCLAPFWSFDDSAVDIIEKKKEKFGFVYLSWLKEHKKVLYDLYARHRLWIKNTDKWDDLYLIPAHTDEYDIVDYEQDLLEAHENKTTHNFLERKRRENLSNDFKHLQEVIHEDLPVTRLMSQSKKQLLPKICIIKEATALIQELEKQSEKLDRQKCLLWNLNQKLQNQLNQAKSNGKF